MKTCYVIPGLAGSELFFTDFLGVDAKLWVSYVALAAGKVPRMALAQDGERPGDGAWELEHVGEPLPDYYGDCVGRLIEDLTPRGYAIQTWGYDWRKSVVANGITLEQHIRRRATPAEPATLVAHSMGGLLARVAYHGLKQSGDENLIGRIITLGTPHWGSYSAVAVFSDDDDFVRQLSLVWNTPAVFPVGSIPITFGTKPAAVIATCLTWPSFYHLFPVPGGLDDPSDTGRAALFDVRNWIGEIPVLQRHLTDAVTTLHPILTAPDSMPPANVLLCVAGRGYGVPGPSSGNLPFGSPRAYERDYDGDGKVSLGSALVPERYSETYVIDHANLPNALARSGDLTRLVLADPAPVPPPEPFAFVRGAFVPLLSGPPFPESGSNFGGVNNTCPADCTC